MFLDVIVAPPSGRRPNCTPVGSGEAAGLAVSDPARLLEGRLWRSGSRLPEQPAHDVPLAGHSYHPSKLTASIPGPPARGQAPGMLGPAAGTKQRPRCPVQRHYVLGQEMTRGPWEPCTGQ